MPRPPGFFYSPVSARSVVRLEPRDLKIGVLREMRRKRVGDARDKMRERFSRSLDLRARRIEIDDQGAQVGALIVECR